MLGGKLKLHKIIIGEWVECHYHHNKPFCSIQWVVDYRDDEVQKYQKIVVLRIFRFTTEHLLTSIIVIFQAKS